jgi:urease accessory protein
MSPPLAGNVRPHSVLQTCHPGGTSSRESANQPTIPSRDSALTTTDTRIPVNWLLWQLSDSAFPTGGFAHSGGLEAAWQQGEVRTREELREFVEASLDQLCHATLPFVVAAHSEPERPEEIDRLCDAFTSNHVANRASRLQGHALRLAVTRILGGSNDHLFQRLEALPIGHLAPMFGGLFGVLGIARDITAQLFVFSQVRSTLAAAVRLNIVGPMESQRLLHQLGPLAQTVCARCEDLSLDDLAQTSPLLDLWQGCQDRLYSRLFQS